MQKDKGIRSFSGDLFFKLRFHQIFVSGKNERPDPSVFFAFVVERDHDCFPRLHAEDLFPFFFLFDHEPR